MCVGIVYWLHNELTLQLIEYGRLKRIGIIGGGLAGLVSAILLNRKGFSVTLSFAGVKEPIYIPFSAITTFADPSVQFGLQFRGVEMMDEISFDELDLEFEPDNNRVAQLPL